MDEKYIKLMETLNYINNITSSVNFESISKALNKIAELTSVYSVDNLQGLQKFIELNLQYQKRIEDEYKLTLEEFEKKYENRILRSKLLGRSGWVISQHTNTNDTLEWDEMINKHESEVGLFFDEGDITLTNAIIKDLREAHIKNTYKHYLYNGLDAFEEKDYMSSAMYLLAFLDNRIATLVTFSEKRLSNSSKYSDNGFKLQKQEDYKRINQNNGLIKKNIYFVEMYPSLIEYLRRLFYDGDYTFERGIEPPYLNRNWLLHGRMKREIQRYECIQLLNALSVIDFMFLN